ncbi:hypothetical protein Tsubulata_049980, partial [Turnera subulata]
DQDLGNHTLYSGGDFSFHFQQRFLPPATHFTCDMKWGAKHNLVAVFNKDKVKRWCCQTGICIWRTQDDGIYFSDSFTNFKVYDWLQ